jgi:hypothetical protein
MSTEPTSSPASPGRKVRSIAIYALIFVIVFGIFVFRRPVIFQTYLTQKLGPISDPPFTVFGPFRSRGPERAADDFLKKLQAGHVEVIPQSGDPSDIEWFRKNERESPLADWSLGDRKDLNGEVTLTYWVRRRSPPYDGYDPPVFLRLAPRGNGWEVTQFNAAY